MAPEIASPKAPVYRQARPPAAVLLVHGAGSGPWVFDGWKRFFPGTEMHAVDLQQGLVVERASMEAYAGVVVAEAGKMTWPLLLVGWSMGGLVAMIAARTVAPERLALIEPSPPAEIGGARGDVALTAGAYDPVAEYGPFPRGIRARPESALARAERRRGISIPALSTRGRPIVVYGDEFPEDRGRAIARLYGAEEVAFPGLSHFDLVLDPAVPEAIARRAGLDPSGPARSGPGMM